jgi:hypothetical protein
MTKDGALEAIRKSQSSALSTGSLGQLRKWADRSGNDSHGRFDPAGAKGLDQPKAAQPQGQAAQPLSHAAESQHGAPQQKAKEAQHGKRGAPK